MHSTLISRRLLLKASAALCSASLAPAPVFACSFTAAIPDGYAGWIRHRGQQVWTVTCASRYGAGSFLPFSVMQATASNSNYGSAPVGLARETILVDFARKAGLPSEDVSFKGSVVHGDGLRVPVLLWVDFTSA